MTVKVTLMGELGRLAQRREVEVHLPAGSNVRVLVKELGRLCDPRFAQRSLTKEGALQPHVALFINGVQMGALEGTLTELTGGQVELMLLPMYEGG